uniref:Uncharacterized protein n=1 Tax=Lactuca sativa TaxID=4236 RepID=A0A9R1V527_LACSA|nr:hypothetical protein LSAT_V11C600327020 [Lactuca sativa]
MLYICITHIYNIICFQKETKTPKKTKRQRKKSPTKRKTPEKRQLHDSESDFESSRPSKKAKKKEPPIKKEKKNSEKIRHRETSEQEKCRFGLGELNEEFINEQDEGDTDLEDNDSDKDEDDSVEAYESKLYKMLNCFKRMKEKPNSKFSDAITKFPEKESFRIFKVNMKNIIIEEKTKSTTFFEFPSNEIRVEGINLTTVVTSPKSRSEKTGFVYVF